MKEYDKYQQDMRVWTDQMMAQGGLGGGFADSPAPVPAQSAGFFNASANASNQAAQIENAANAACDAEEAKPQQC